MNKNEKLQRLALVLAILKKLDLTSKDLYIYDLAIAIVQRAEDAQMDPLEVVAQVVPNPDQNLPRGAIKEIVKMVDDIVQNNGRLS